jgi:uridine phosphorylase
MKNKIELLKSDIDEKSIVTSSEFINRREKNMNKESFSLPQYCLIGFFPNLYSYIKNKYQVTIIDFINKKHPYFIFKRKDTILTYIFPGIGAPLSGAILDETIYLGSKIIFFFGTAGSLKSNISNDTFIIPSKTIRDEGTSFHYDKPGRYAYPDSELIYALESNLNSKGLQYYKGITWTTDGVYRETITKINRLRKEGCIAVDMEASALFSIAKHYNIKIAGIFLARDQIKNESWIQFNSHKIKPDTFFEIVADSFQYIKI